MSVDRTLQSIADVLADHEAAYHPGQLCPEDQHGHCAARPRPVPSPEDRMADARTDTPTAEHTAARTFNDTNPIGTPVRYWKGAREGDGKVARTRTQAQLLSGHTAVVWLEGVSGCIALTHIQPISEEELAAADRIPAPRPVPTFADRTAALEELRAERVKTGRLEAVLRSQTRAVLEALAERDKARETTEYCWSIVKGCAAERDAAQQLAAFRQGVIDRHRQELGAAGDVLAVVRDAVERIDRALARYDTQPGETPVERAHDPNCHADERAHWTDCECWCHDQQPSSVPSRRAQEEPASEEVRWAYRWIGTDGQVYDEMDASDNAVETAEQRAHRIAAKRLTGTVRGEVLRYRVLTIPAEVVATYPAEARP